MRTALVNDLHDWLRSILDFLMYNLNLNLCLLLDITADVRRARVSHVLRQLREGWVVQLVKRGGMVVVLFCVLCLGVSICSACCIFSKKIEG